MAPLTRYHGTIEIADVTALDAFFASIMTTLIEAINEDGGMREVGVQVMLAYENGEIPVEDTYMRVPTS